MSDRAPSPSSAPTTEFDRLKAQKDTLVQREEARVIGKWKFNRTGGYDPENPQPDPTLARAASPPSPAPTREPTIQDVVTGAAEFDTGDALTDKMLTAFAPMMQGAETHGETWACPACGFDNGAWREKCRDCSSPRADSPPPPALAPTTEYELICPRCLVTTTDADDARLEKQIVTAADKQLRALGFRVINTSQPRHAKYITPGVPDRFYFHRARGLGFAWEAKTATGEQSAAQKDFQDDMDACGWPYVLGTDRQLFDWLLSRYPLRWDESGHLVWVSHSSDIPSESG